MRAMVLERAGQKLCQRLVADPRPGPGQILARVMACAVCRTDLHVVDGELSEPKLPLVPGHEIVARVLERGEGVEQPAAGTRIGIPWLGWSCGTCGHCLAGCENLCADARFTGYQIDGGYADRVVADARFCFALPDAYDDLHAAPLLCAGLIGWRSLVRAGDGRRLGIYGFGAAAHIVAQVARWQGRQVYAFVREGDLEAERFAYEHGAVWAGPSTRPPPDPLDAAIIFAPSGFLVPLALQAVRPGGRVVCGGIHMSDIPSFPYAALWGERELVSVANLTRRDAEDFLRIAPQVPVRIEAIRYDLAEANRALADLRGGNLRGAAVLVP
ncbi:MAG: zinc-dependent alcohol dehydrogenase family protein [Alphaproteobacteria bacterium]|nr:zinc-dependent alcohol dehydrogenase family protein [Alphaproteobacteria bacterium]MCW5740471.1 zinc-dependent alcohol dehydrogenase family protein [Alphaproteobacteria bacterium]